MAQIYLLLHNAFTNLKKPGFCLSLLFFSILFTDKNANAQCPVVSVTPTISCGGVLNGGPCNALTASGNADTYVWAPQTGLYTDCAHTIPYTGTNTTTVYAAPTSYKLYTVTGTIIASGCSSTAMARVNYTPRAPVVTPNPAIMCLGGPAIKLKVENPPVAPQFCSGTVNIPVPDNNVAGASNNISVSGIPAGCTISGATVTINMTHSRIGDMVFVLRAPNGTVLNLDAMLNRTNNAGANFINTVFSSQATNMISSGSAPFTGTFVADAAGPTFTASGNTYPGGPTGMQPNVTNWAGLLLFLNGTWTLGFYDGITGETGTLTSWCLNFTFTSCPVVPATPAVWSPAAGLFSDAAATFVYIPGTPVDSVWARPWASGIYTYAVMTSSVPAPKASFTNPTPIVIPVGGPASAYPANVSVSGLPPTGVKVESVVLHGVNHSSSQDIDVLLQSPTGQNVILMSDVGGANAINATYTIGTSGGNMSATTANPTGTYLPTNVGVGDSYPAPGPGFVTQSNPSVSMFAGNMNGTWKLFVIGDSATSGQGTISGGFTINFDTLPVCNSPLTYVPVTVNQGITITVQPVNQTVCAGGVASFSVAATGSGTFSYQWQVSSNGGATYTNIVNGGVYNGVNASTLTIAAPPFSMNGDLYRVLVGGPGACASATSTAALLTVNPLPDIVITANPLIIGPTQTTTIFSTVTPNPAATYTWYYNNAVLTGAVSPSLLVSYGSPGDYQLQVTDVNGCTNLSNIITIANSFALNIYTYPNPSGGIFQVRYFSEPNSTLQRSLTVYNNMGNKIMTRNFTQTIPYQVIDVDVRAHGKGLYWVELRDARGKRLAMNRAVVQ